MFPSMIHIRIHSNVFLSLALSHHVFAIFHFHSNLFSKSPSYIMDLVFHLDVGLSFHLLLLLLPLLLLVVTTCSIFFSTLSSSIHLPWPEFRLLHISLCMSQFQMFNVGDKEIISIFILQESYNFHTMAKHI
jgi:hypothetical protein